MTKLSIILALVGSVGVANGECPNACSGHGECGVFDQCSCYRNWQSNDCSQRTCPFGHAHVDTPKGDLNMDGGALSGPEHPVIINSEVYPLGTTEQYPDAQDNEAHFYMECSNKGLCDRKSGICKCFDGYDGASCQRASCPGGDGGESSQCSGRGTCHSIDYLAHYHGESHFPLDDGSTVSYKLWDAGYTRGCLCDPPFTGADCASQQCKFGVDPLYVSTGTALYQKAFVVNSCQNGGGTPSSEITTNGDNHVYVNSIYAAQSGVLDNVNSYDGTVTLTSDVNSIPNWAVAGAEVILSDPSSGDGFNNVFTNVGCRLTVVAAKTAPVRLYVKASGETPNADLKKCGLDGSGTANTKGYTVYHVTNTFTLLFTDHFGEVYRTAPISAAVADYSDEIKAALEGLPNRVVGEVVVTGMRVNPKDGGTVEEATPAEMAYEIEFISNPGKLRGLQIDSTPIRLGQTLQAGIDCDFDQATLTPVSNVYSKVGYSEIGEDSTNFGKYIGNVGYFAPQVYAEDGDNVISGQENVFIYTASDLTSQLKISDIIKIKNEIYVVRGIYPSFIKLNTFFSGDAVQGISTQLYQNDVLGADTSAVFTLTWDDENGSIFINDAAFSTPGYNSNNVPRFDDRKGDFAKDKYIRIVSHDIPTDHVFDCIFQLSDDTDATYGDEDGEVKATNKWTYELTVGESWAENCPTMLNALHNDYPANAGGLTVTMYKWEPTGYTNGRYAEKTRIFKTGATASRKNFLKIQQGANKVKVCSDLSCINLANLDVATCAGKKVLYGNEINVIESCTANTVTFKNAVAWETCLFANVHLAGYDIDYLYYLSDDFGEPDSSDYTYVSQCSNRGVCDGVSGVCKCFKGYTGDNCNTISELFG